MREKLIEYTKKKANKWHALLDIDTHLTARFSGKYVLTIHLAISCFRNSPSRLANSIHLSKVELQVGPLDYLQEVVNEELEKLLIKWFNK